MSDDSEYRTEQDLQRAVSVLARVFKTDTVFIIGSQAILMSWPDAPEDMRGSPEIDAYPGNAKIWERAEAEKGDALEASEHIHGLFGEGSEFHNTYGFFIDGVDESTAKLPAGWYSRAIVRRLNVDGRMVEAIAPAPEDLIVSKLARLAEKDKAFIVAYHQAQPFNGALIVERIKQTDLAPEVAELAIAFIRSLAPSEGEQ